MTAELDLNVLIDLVADYDRRAQKIKAHLDEAISQRDQTLAMIERQMAEKDLPVVASEKGIVEWQYGTHEKAARDYGVPAAVIAANTAVTLKTTGDRLTDADREKLAKYGDLSDSVSWSAITKAAKITGKKLEPYKTPGKRKGVKFTATL